MQWWPGSLVKTTSSAGRRPDPKEPMVATSPTAAKVSPDRIFFPLIALVCIAYVVYGFAQSYYFKSASETPPLSLLVHLHGLTFSAWLALFLVQTLLIRSGQYVTHRRLGIIGVSLVPVMVILGLIVTLTISPTRPIADWEYAVTFQELIMFPAFVAAAVRYRRQGAYHKRLMLLATFVIMAAATARWPAISALMVWDEPKGLILEWTLAQSVVMYLVADLPLLAALVYDQVAHGRIHQAYTWGGAALVLSQVVTVAIIDTPAWQAVTAALVGWAQ